MVRASEVSEGAVEKVTREGRRGDPLQLLQQHSRPASSASVGASQLVHERNKTGTPSVWEMRLDSAPSRNTPAARGVTTRPQSSADARTKKQLERAARQRRIPTAASVSKETLRNAERGAGSSEEGMSRRLQAMAEMLEAIEQSKKKPATGVLSALSAELEHSALSVARLHFSQGAAGMQSTEYERMQRELKQSRQLLQETQDERDRLQTRLQSLEQQLEESRACINDRDCDIEQLGHVILSVHKRELLPEQLDDVAEQVRDALGLKDESNNSTHPAPSAYGPDDLTLEEPLTARPHVHRPETVPALQLDSLPREESSTAYDAKPSASDAHADAEMTEVSREEMQSKQEPLQQSGLERTAALHEDARHHSHNDSLDGTYDAERRFDLRDSARAQESGNSSDRHHLPRPHSVLGYV